MSLRFLIMASLALNVALAGIGIHLAKRPAGGAPVSPLLNSTNSRPVRFAGSAAATATPPVVLSVPATFDWPQVASTNLAQYAANLQAIECPKEIIREIIIAVVNEDFVRRRHAIFEPIHAQFWELMAQPERLKQDETTDDRSKELRTERDAQLTAVLGENWQRDLGPSPAPMDDHPPTLSFLPEEKQRRWSELDNHFNQRQTEISQKTRGDAPEQKAQLDLITKERDEARRQLLRPEEFQEYTKRTSPQAGWAQNLPGFEATEEEYRALNQLRAATPVNQTNQFNAQAQALLGEERFAAFQRGQDPRFAEIVALAGRCQLPTNAVELLYQQRVTAEQQCAQVRSNPALSAGERRTLLQVIQSETRQQLLNTLGETAGEAYLRHHGDWLAGVDKGHRP